MFIANLFNQSLKNTPCALSADTLPVLHLKPYSAFKTFCIKSKTL